MCTARTTPRPPKGDDHVPDARNGTPFIRARDDIRQAAIMFAAVSAWRAQGPRCGTRDRGVQDGEPALGLWKSSNLSQPAGQWVPSGENLCHHLQVL